MAGAELIERAALDHLEIAARLAALGAPVGPAAKRHVRRVGGEIEPVDGPAHHLLFPVIVEIGQQRRARSPDRRVDVAIDPRRHAFPRKFAVGGFTPQCKSAPISLSAQEVGTGAYLVRLGVLAIGAANSRYSV